MSALLEVDEAAVAFGGVRAVDGASLRVDEGAIVGLIGPNGAGKTTLFNSVSGLQRIDGGRIALDGRDVTPLAAHQRAALGIGRSFQNLGLAMDETVEANVLAAGYLRASYRGVDVLARPWRWWRGERDLARRAELAMAAFGLTEERARPVRDLSFATARFAELAAVMASEPRIMLLDEPTTGLDVAEIALLESTLRRLREEGTTLLLIAHDVGFVLRLCDRVYALAQGRVIAEGLPAEVRDDPAVIEAWLGAAA